MFRRLLVERGCGESTLFQHVSSYEYADELPECDPESQREVAWRLLVLCTVLEALAIDELPVQIAVRDTIGRHDIARALDDASIGPGDVPPLVARGVCAGDVSEKYLRIG